MMLSRFLSTVLAFASCACFARGPAVDLSSTRLEGPVDRLLVNLMVEGRFAWFSWMNQQRYKPKLVVEWETQGRRHSKSWQHGSDTSVWPQAFFLMRGTEPGLVRWAGHPDLGAGRQGHKHHFFCKDRPSRIGFVKADLTEIPAGATITRAELILHIHDTEGLKAGPDPESAGVGHFRHVNKDWDWDHLTFTHYAKGKAWTSPTGVYPFLGDGDVSPILWSLDRQKDLAADGYHKRGVRDYPLDLTGYVARLQQLRTSRQRSMSRIFALIALTAPLLAVRAAPMEFWEQRGTIVAEVEDGALQAAEILERSDASGGKVVAWRNETGRTEFALRVFTPGVWHVWIRTAAKDHVSNGLHLELNGVRQKAPKAHSLAGTDSIYLRKHPTNFFWKPEWQGPGEGNHAGPITIDIPHAGLHRLALVARKIERPTLDKIVLTRSAPPDFINDAVALGPSSTARRPLDGQLLVHPQNAAHLARYRAADGGRLDEVILCGLGSPEGFLFLPEAQQEEIIGQLLRHGGNMLYAMAVRSHGGDGTPQENPFRNHNPVDGIDAAVLQRWEILLQRLHTAGIAVFFLVYDDAALPFGNKKKDTIPPAEAEFFAALVRRFAHLPNIVWGVAEEYADVLTPARAAGLAAIIARENLAGLPVAIHHATGQTRFDFSDLAWVNVFSQQPNGDSPQALYTQVRKAVDESAGRWLVHMAENWNARNGDHAACVIAGDREGVRRRNWATVMAGAAICQVIGPWEVSAHGKPATPGMLEDMRALVGFFDPLPLSQLRAEDRIANDSGWALASPDRKSVVLHAMTSETPLRPGEVPAGHVRMRWLDLATSTTATTESTHQGGELRIARPNGIGAECAVAILIQ